ncbi:hypothetical protein AMECASPLE_030470 [Ameca splendens]|uniref:Uncharacterized protein n=1 Tax=Ameca splendens TaxID=208324 RepID=A0ABV0YTI7_9TELE
MLHESVCVFDRLAEGLLSAHPMGGTGFLSGRSAWAQKRGRHPHQYCPQQTHFNTQNPFSACKHTHTRIFSVHNSLLSRQRQTWSQSDMRLDMCMHPHKHKDTSIPPRQRS